MRCLALLVGLLLLLVACSDASPPAFSSEPAADDPKSPSANLPYRPVMAGTAYHGIGSRP